MKEEMVDLDNTPVEYIDTSSKVPIDKRKVDNEVRDTEDSLLRDEKE